MDSEFAALTLSSPRRAAAPTRARVHGTSTPLTEGNDLGLAYAEESTTELSILANPGVMSEAREALCSLQEAYFDDYGRDLDSDSSAGLLRFLQRTPVISLPSIGADESGKLVATWRIGEEALSLQFIDLFHFNYALTVRAGDRLVRQWGSAHAVSFLDEYRPARKFIDA